MSNITKTLSEFSSSLTHGNIPAQVRARAKLLAADAIGIAIRAWHEADSTQPHLKALQDTAAGAGPCGVFGSCLTLTASAAAELNGALIHALDFDDTYAAGALHPSTTVLPAVLAAAQLEKAPGDEALAAVIVGLEAVCRLSTALVAADHYDRGFHPTATCGAFGAALAVARILKLDPVQTEYALGIALSQTSGSLQFLANGAWTKRFQVGNAARAGLVSAYLARAGYVGPVAAIEGQHGFLRAYAPNPEPAKVIQGLGAQWRTLDIAIKPYPACRFAHAAVDAILELRRAFDLRLDNVDHVICGLPHKGILLVGAPIEEKRRVTSVVQGQFSMPFAASVAIDQGTLGWDSYATTIGSPEICAFMQRVDVVADEEVEALFPASFGAKVTVRMTDGRTLSKFVKSPKGEPDNFVSQEELTEKFQSLVAPYLRNQAIDSLIQNIDCLDTLPGVDSLFQSVPA